MKESCPSPRSKRGTPNKSGHPPCERGPRCAWRCSVEGVRQKIRVLGAGRREAKKINEDLAQTQKDRGGKKLSSLVIVCLGPLLR